MTQSPDYFSCLGSFSAPARCHGYRSCFPAEATFLGNEIVLGICLVSLDFRVLVVLLLDGFGCVFLNASVFLRIEFVVANSEQERPWLFQGPSSFYS